MKNEILETSLKQFLKYGIREMSIQKIIEPLGISTKTVYKYFKNKEELLEEALLLYYAQQGQVMEGRTGEPNVVALLFDIWQFGIELECKVNKLFFRDLRYYYPDLEKKIESVVSKKVWKQLGLIFQRGMKEGYFREDIIPEVLLENISVMYVAIARNGQFKKFRVGTDLLYLNTIAVYIRGFCTLKGIKLLDEQVKAFKIYEEMRISDN
jgi:AcrR family transcriptional regulator